MPGSVLDKYMQFAVIRQSFAASTTGGQFEQLTTGLTNMQKIGWEIKRLEYFVTNRAFDGMTSAGDFTCFSLTQSDGIADDYPDQASVIDRITFQRYDAPATNNAVMFGVSPFVSDFGAEGKLIVPQNVYFGLSWTHGTAPATTDKAFLRIWYREVELTAQDWYDLLQLRLPLGAK